MTKTLKRILIAEDSPEWQKFHASLLKEYDKVELMFDIASNARDALELINKNIENPYNLVLSDLQMETDFLPKFAGEWFVENIKQIPQYKNVPIVFISATYNISFVAASCGVNSLSKRTLVNNPQTYYFMLDEYLI